MTSAAVVRRRLGDVATATDMDQAYAPQPAVPAPELLQDGDGVPRVVLLQDNGSHPPRVHDQNGRRTDREWASVPTTHGATPPAETMLS